MEYLIDTDVYDYVVCTINELFRNVCTKSEIELNSIVKNITDMKAFFDVNKFHKINDSEKCIPLKIRADLLESMKTHKGKCFCGGEKWLPYAKFYNGSWHIFANCSKHCGRFYYYDCDGWRVGTSR